MSLKLYVPRIGELITLAEPWTFTLWEEYRNIKLIKMVDPSYDGHGWSRGPKKTWTVILPAGWELKVARIYIRNGQPDFDSITFTCPYNGKNVRFWVKLSDANKIVMEEPE